jgi:dihydroflavonol-4-reductase
LPWRTLPLGGYASKRFQGEESVLPLRRIKLDLVTGGTGFVGSHLVRLLRDEGRPVRALVRVGTDASFLRDLGAEVVPGDVTDGESYHRAAEGATRVFHVAGLVSFLRRDAEALRRVNVEGVRNAIAASRAAGVATLVVTSSVAAVGDGDGPGPSTEDARWRGAPAGGYSDSKRGGEDVARAADGAGLRVVCVNPSIVIGPWDPRRSLGGDYVLRAAAGPRRIPVAVRMTQAFVDVRDVARGHLLAAERGRGGERYILSAESRSMAEFVALVRRAAGRGGRPPQVPSWFLWPLAAGSETWAGLTRGAPILTREQVALAGRKSDYTAEKARRELGWASRPLEETIADTIAWFRGAGMMG